MNLSFSKYADVMANFSLIREAAVDIYKQTGNWLLLKWMQIITESIKMSKLCTPSEIFCGGLELGIS